MPAYAAMVESIDDSVGRVMASLKLELLDDTLVIFTSDNGGFYKATLGPLRANKGHITKEAFGFH